MRILLNEGETVYTQYYGCKPTEFERWRYLLSEMKKNVSIDDKMYYRLYIPKEFDIKIKELREIVINGNRKLSRSAGETLWTLFYHTSFVENIWKSKIGKNKKISGIYKITNLKTKKSYIGQSVDIYTRLATHVKTGLGMLFSNTNNQMYDDMMAIGPENFSYEVVEITNKLDEREVYWISYFDTFKNGYNLTPGNYKVNSK